MIKFYHEKFSKSLFSEMLPIIQESLEEVYFTKDNKTLANSMNLDSINNNTINFNFYLEKEQSGYLNACTMRSNGKLVGYFICILNYHAHSKNLLIATTQNIHVLKEYRGFDSIKFMKFNEEILKKRGVKLHYFGVNPILKTDKLLKRMGFTLDEVIYSKGL